jgi:RimJ/RimL family protein N-acetyltransferase
MTVVSDGVVVLRDLRESDLPMLTEWEQRTAQEQPFNYFEVSDRPSRFRGGFPEGGFVTAEHGRLMVELADGTTVGDLSWHQVTYGPNSESAAFNIGIALRPEQRAKGHGTRAQRLLAAHLFGTTAVNRVEASTDVDNIAEQRALTKAGFTREGILRGAQFRAGEFHDLVLFSVLRGEL